VSRLNFNAVGDENILIGCYPNSREDVLDLVKAKVGTVINV
jgi:hypothetical protein